MAIVKKPYEVLNDGIERRFVYSDNGVYIREVGTGNIYRDAVDLVEDPHDYEETDTAIDKRSDPYRATESDYIAALNDLGVEV